MEIYYTEGIHGLEAKIANFNQAVHAMRAILYRLRHGYFPKPGVRAYLPEAIEMAVKLINYRLRSTNHFTAAEVQQYAPKLRQVADELWVIEVKHKGELYIYG